MAGHARFDASIPRCFILAKTYAPELSLGMITQEEARDIEDTEYIEIPEEKLKEKVNEPKKEFVPEKQPTQEKKVNEPSFLSGVE